MSRYCTHLLFAAGLSLLTSCTAQPSKEPVQKGEKPHQAAQAPAQPESTDCRLLGDMFVTTQSGDVKRGAGIQFRLLPITKSLETFVAESIPRLSHADADLEGFKKSLDGKFPLKNKTIEFFGKPEEKEAQRQYEEADREYTEYIKAKYRPTIDPIESAVREQFSKEAIQGTTDSDGRFEVTLQKGSYILVSDQFSTSNDRVVWMDRVECMKHEQKISLSMASAVFGTSMKALNLPALDVQTKQLLQRAEQLLRSKTP